MKSDNTGELKRMIVDPRFRGRGVGVSLVQAVLGSAEKRGIKTIQLEVGTKNIEAQTLYRKMGFSDRDAFGDYKPTSISTDLGYVRRSEVCLWRDPRGGSIRSKLTGSPPSTADSRTSITVYHSSCSCMLRGSLST